MRARIGAIIMGVIVIVIGMSLSGVVLDTAASTGGSGLIECAKAGGADPRPASDDERADDSGAGKCDGSAAGDGGSTAPGFTVEIYPNITSFSGTQAINDLIPLLYFVVIVMVSVGMIGIGVGGMMAKGPLA